MFNKIQPICSLLLNLLSGKGCVHACIIRSSFLSKKSRKLIIEDNSTLFNVSTWFYIRTYNVLYTHARVSWNGVSSKIKIFNSFGGKSCVASLQKMLRDKYQNCEVIIALFHYHKFWTKTIHENLLWT